MSCEDYVHSEISPGRAKMIILGVENFPTIISRWAILIQFGQKNSNKLSVSNNFRSETNRNKNSPPSRQKRKKGNG